MKAAITSTVALCAHFVINACGAEITLPFASSEVEFDLVRGQAVASQLTEKNVVFVDLRSGETNAVPVTLYPLGISITPNKEYAYISENTHPLQGSRPSGPGKLARFDLGSRTLLNEYDLSINPGDLEATDEGSIVIADFGAGDRPTVQIFNVHSNAVTDSRALAIFSNLAMDPSQKAVFGRGIGNPNGYFRRAWFDAETGKFTEIWPIRYVDDVGTVGSDYWVDHEGKMLIGTPLGYVYKLSTDQTNDMVNIGRLERNAWTVAFDPVRTNVFAAADQAGISFYRRDTLKVFHTIPLSLHIPFLTLSSNEVFVADTYGTNTVIQILPNPAVGIETNESPFARITFPTEIRRGDSVVISAAGSSDPNQSSNMWVRWDLDGDGVYDTAKTNEQEVLHVFRHAGANQIGLEVTDAYGATAEATALVEVIPWQDGGIAVEHATAYRIEYPVTAGTFVPNSPFFYFVTATSNLLARLNLTNGMVERHWTLASTPGNLTATRDGKKIFIGMDASGARPLSDTAGWIGELDLMSGKIINEFSTKNVPYSIAAPDSAKAIAVHGPRVGYELHSYEVISGKWLGAETLPGQIWRLEMHPSGQLVYGAGASDGWMLRFRFDPETGLFSGKRVRDTGFGMDMFALSNGTNVITSGGNLLVSSLEIGADQQVIRHLGYNPISAVLEPPETGLTGFLAPEPWLIAPGKLVYLREGAEFLWQEIDYGTRFLGSFGGRIYELKTVNGVTTLNSRLIPSLSAEENIPPRMSLTPTNVPPVFTIGGSLNFDVLGTDEDGRVVRTVLSIDGAIQAETSHGRLQYKWTPNQSGTNEIEVSITDNLGSVTSTNFIVFANAAPTILLTANTNELLSPAVIEAEPVVTDPDGTVVSVDYYYRALGEITFRLLAEETVEPFRLSVSNIVSSGGTLMAVARDNLGATNAASVQVRMLGLTGDDFRRPFVLSGAQASHKTNNSYATTQGAERSIGHSPMSLYWSWTAPSNGLVTVSTDGSSIDTDLEISAPPAPPLAHMANDDFWGIAPASLAKFEARAGTTYLFRVGSVLTNVGIVQVTVNQGTRRPGADSPPSNDDFAQRSHINAAEFEIVGTTRGATPQPGEPGSLPPWKATNSVWWTWQAPRNGTVKLTAAADFDCRLAVYRDAATFAELRLTAGNDDWSGFNSYVQFNAESNVVYAICLDGIGGSQGDATLRLVLDTPEPPANDDFADSELLATSRATGISKFSGATLEAGEPSIIPGSTPGRTVWWKWTAERSGRVWVGGKAWHTNAFIFSPEVSVYLGDELSQLQLVARGVALPNPPRKIYAYFDAIAGQTYTFQAGAVAEAPRVDIGINQTMLVPPPEIVSISVENGAIGLTMRELAAGLMIEVSTDLVDWNEVMPTSVESDRLWFPITNTIQTQFYRSVLK